MKSTNEKQQAEGRSDPPGGHKGHHSQGGLRAGKVIEPIAEVLVGGSMIEHLFYLRDSRSNVGSNLSFWAAGGGYTTDLSKAATFSADKAAAQHRCRETDIPLRKDFIDANARQVVDMQNLRRERTNATGGDLCYVQVEHEYDGNDVFFVSQKGGASTNLSEASIWSAQDALCATMRNDGWRVWPKYFIDELRRLAVSENNINLAKIIKAGGIEIIKPKKPSPETHRCHHCGRFLTIHDYYSDCQNCGGENRP